MKQKTLLIGGAVAALAVLVLVRRNAVAAPPLSAYADPGVIYAPAVAQRQASGAAIPQNTDYLKNWSDLSQAWGNDPNAWL